MEQIETVVALSPQALEFAAMIQGPLLAEPAYWAYERHWYATFLSWNHTEKEAEDMTYAITARYVLKRANALIEAAGE